MYIYCNNNPVMYVDPSGESFTVAAFIVTSVLVVACGTAGGIIGYKSGKESGKSGWGLFFETLDGIVDGTLVGGTLSAIIFGGIYYFGGYTATLCLVETVAVMADIATLQGRKSANDGDGAWQIAEDCVDTLSDHTFSEIVGPFKDEMSSVPKDKIAKSIRGTKNNTPKISWISAIPTLFNVLQTINSIFAEDPVARAIQQEYELR